MDKRLEQTFFRRRCTNGRQVYEKLLNVTNHQGSASENHSGVPLCTCPDGYHKNKKAGVGEGVEKLEPCALLVGMQNVWSLWITVGWGPPKLKVELLYEPAIPLLGIYPKELKSGPGRDICTPMITAAHFLTAEVWKQP